MRTDSMGTGGRSSGRGSRGRGSQGGGGRSVSGDEPMTPRPAATAPAPDEHPDRSAWEKPGFLLWHATLRWQRMVTAALKPTGLTHVQFVLLASAWFLEGRTGPPSQREVAEHAGTDAMMTSQVLRSLEADGLVVRHPDPSDARVKRLTVTPEGRAAAAQALDAVDGLDRRFFGPAGDRDDLVALLLVLAGRDPDGAPYDD
jgi:DNA-binding MarR family transcriptional regulator